MGPDDILDQIDQALTDWVSPDAMRWTPEPGPTPAPASDELDAQMAEQLRLLDAHLRQLHDPIRLRAALVQAARPTYAGTFTTNTTAASVAWTRVTTDTGCVLTLPAGTPLEFSLEPPEVEDVTLLGDTYVPITQSFTVEVPPGSAAEAALRLLLGEDHDHA